MGTTEAVKTEITLFVSEIDLDCQSCTLIMRIFNIFDIGMKIANITTLSKPWESLSPYTVASEIAGFYDSHRQKE